MMPIHSVTLTAIKLSSNISVAPFQAAAVMKIPNLIDAADPKLTK
jgi:hypothetical protein